MLKSDVQINAFTVLQSLDPSVEMSEAYFYQLVRKFEVTFLAERDYNDQLLFHRNPIAVKYAIINELNYYLLQIQQRDEMIDQDLENQSFGYVPSKIVEIWESDRRVKTLYNATKYYCQLRSKDFNTIAVHIAEYRAMNRIYHRTRLAIHTFSTNKGAPTAPATKKGYSPITAVAARDNGVQDVHKIVRGIPSDRPIFLSRPQSWQELQDFIGQLFREAGFEVEVSKVIEHVRGKKEVDVFAIDRTSEYHPKLLVECKYWNRSVPQEIVHAFHDVMVNSGANTGFIVSKAGFQKGCYDAIRHTNIHLVSLEDLEEKYYIRWQTGMLNKILEQQAILYPYQSILERKTPQDGNPIDDSLHSLLDTAYAPFDYIDAQCLLLEGQPIYPYPLTLPVLNDQLEIMDELWITNDRELFSFMENKRAKALQHYQQLYREL